MDTNIKQWYTAEYKTDELGYDINDNITFTDIYCVLLAHEDVYNKIGVCDSIIRERIFDKLASLLNVEYDAIYKKWLEA